MDNLRVAIDLGTNPINRITCTYVGRIGDVIVATPFLRALRQRFPAASIRLIVGYRAAQAVPLIPFVDRIEVLQRPENIIGNMRLAYGFLRERSDLFIDLNSARSSTSALMARAARAPLRLSFDKARGADVFNYTIAAPDEREHMSDRFRRLAESLGASYSPELEVHVPPTADSQARLLVGSTPKAFRILVHPGNVTRPPAFWPESRLIELCRRLQTDSALRLFFLCGPGETDVVERISGALALAAPILPAAALPVVAGMIRRMDLLLGSLTSTTHLAAALSVPTFAFYEGYTQTVWRPKGARHGGTVSKDWSGVTSTSVSEAYAALRSHLDSLSFR